MFATNTFAFFALAWLYDSVTYTKMRFDEPLDLAVQCEPELNAFVPDLTASCDAQTLQDALIDTTNTRDLAAWRSRMKSTMALRSGEHGTDRLACFGHSRSWQAWCWARCQHSL